MAQSANQGNIQIYLTIPGVKGESTSTQYAGQIECTTFRTAVKNQSSVSSGTTGSGAGRAVFEEIVLVAPINAASPTLMQACAAGTHYSNATITFVKAGGSSSAVYLTIKLSNVFITGFSSIYGPTNPEDASSPLIHADQYRLSFGQISYTYNQQTASGTQGAAYAGSFNLQTMAIQ